MPTEPPSDSKEPPSKLELMDAMLSAIQTFASIRDSDPTGDASSASGMAKEWLDHNADLVRAIGGYMSWTADP